jgi:hypothetical protein
MQTVKANLPLMSKSTAIWLVANTALTFKQIADFCGMHEMEVNGIADGDVAKGIKGSDPIAMGQLTLNEIERCTADKTAKLELDKPIFNYQAGVKKAGKKVKYTPIARRRDKPDAIFWIVKNYPDIDDKGIVKLIGTTKSTIEAIRSRQYWNINELRARDPILLGLCSQKELDALIEKSQKKDQ